MHDIKHLAIQQPAHRLTDYCFRCTPVQTLSDVILSCKTLTTLAAMQTEQLTNMRGEDAPTEDQQEEEHLG